MASPRTGAKTDRSAMQRVTELVERLIASGELKPGDHVSEPSLALRLGVSRGPVREACRALVERGLLQSEPNRGCFVRRLSVREVVDLYDVRAALARLAGRLLAQRITREQLAELERVVTAHEEAAAAADLRRVHALNLDFHTRIIAFSDNRRLQEIEAGMARELAIYRRRSLGEGAYVRETAAEHRAILAALAARDAEAAGAALEAHLLAARERFLATLGRDVALDLVTRD
jgi:DNA-binding GntR family transcriptional regulator